MRSHIIGLFLSFGIIYYAAITTSNDNRAYVDILSVLIVFGGSLSISIMTNGLAKTFQICGMFFKVFSTHSYDKIKITNELVNLSKKYHYGQFSIKDAQAKSYHPFVMDGLRLLHNKFDEAKVKTIMMNMIKQRSEFHDKSVEQIEVLAKYPPAFGMMGTIIGLVAVLKNLNSADSMTAIGPSMAVALLTTLYGIILANYVLLPIADNLSGRSQDDIKIRQLAAEGIILLSQGHDPIYIREVLLSYLTPDERKLYQEQNSAPSVVEEVAA